MSTTDMAKMTPFNLIIEIKGYLVGRQGKKSTWITYWDPGREPSPGTHGRWAFR
jgi:hypothetical protein